MGPAEMIADAGRQNEELAQAAVSPDRLLEAVEPEMTIKAGSNCAVL